MKFAKLNSAVGLLTSNNLICAKEALVPTVVDELVGSLFQLGPEPIAALR